MPELPRGRKPSLVVTGGSSGIGAALCRLAAARGWHVWIGYGRGVDRAAHLAKELTGGGGSATPIALPLDDPAQLREAVTEMARQDDAIEALALCAAPAPDIASLLKLTPAHFRRQLECAVIGNHALLTELWRQCFRSRGGGQVVAVLSAAQGPPAAPHMSSYIAAKNGLEGLLNAAAAELGRAGLRIGVVRPGYVETPMLQAFEPLLLERARTGMPGKTFLKPGAVAEALLRGLTQSSSRGGLASSPGGLAELPLGDAAEAIFERACFV